MLKDVHILNPNPIDIYRFTEIERHRFVREGNRLNQLITLLKLPMHTALDFKLFLNRRNFELIDVMNDPNGKWNGRRDVAEVLSTELPIEFPTLVIIQLVTSSIAELPKSYTRFS